LGVFLPDLEEFFPGSKPGKEATIRA